MNVAIVKYNAGNIYSVVNALKRMGIEPMLTDDAEQLMKADKVLFPGQGHAGEAMEYLKARRLDEVIRNLKQPVFGICVGQQLLCRHSEEGDTECIGIFDFDWSKVDYRLFDICFGMVYTHAAWECMIDGQIHLDRVACQPCHEGRSAQQHGKEHHKKRCVFCVRKQEQRNACEQQPY